MGIRDDEIARLVKYAEALGLKVSFIRGEANGAADWVIDGSEIRIYRANNYSKTDLILSLIHELGHHLWFIHEKQRNPDLKFEEALERENLVEENLAGITPKKLRKKILTVEEEGIKYWDIIVKDTQIKIPSWKIELEKEFDLWNYQVYYKTGRFPTGKQKKDKIKQLLVKYRGFA